MSEHIPAINRVLRYIKNLGNLATEYLLSAVCVRLIFSTGFSNAVC